MAYSDSGDSEPSGAAQKALEQRARERAIAAVSQCEMEAYYGAPSVDAKMEVAKSGLMFYNSLRHHRDEDAARELWEDLDMTPIRAPLGETVRVEQPTTGDTAAAQVDEEPAILSVDWRRLCQPIRELDDIYAALGFAEETTDKTPHDKATMADLVELQRTRGQDDAAERTPVPQTKQPVGGDD